MSITTDFRFNNDEIARQFAKLTVIHDSDFGGDITIVWQRNPYGEWDTQEKEVQETVLPGELLKLLGYETAKQELVSRITEFVENL